MRYDDTLETVLASDLSTPFGKQSAWRQLVDLIGRRRVNADSRALSVLRTIRADIPLAVRAATARGLEYADPPAALVRLLVHDDVSVATPVLRSARLSSGDWILMLPELKPAGRAILRHRRDLSPLVQRALESFGPTDFALSDANAPEQQAPADNAPEAVVEERGSVASGSIALAMALGGAEALFDSTQESLGEPAPAEIDAAEPAGEAVGTLVPVLTETLSGDTQEMLGEPMVAEIASAPVEAIEQVEPPLPAGLDESSEPVDEAAASPLPRLPAHWFGPAIEPESAPVDAASAPVVEPIAIEAEAPAAVEETDFSFVTLALGGFAAVDGAAGQAPTATNGESPADQSGTEATNVPVSDIADAAPRTHGRAMLEGSELTIAERPDAVRAREAVEPFAEIEGDKDAGTFRIADVVARIDAFWRSREEGAIGEAERLTVHRAEGFRFETDSKGVIRWVDGVARAPVVGLSLDLQGMPTGSRVDGVASGAFRRRAGFSNARLEIEGESDAAGDWLISGVPVFDSGNGRFTGYRGTARRPRADERAEPIRPQPQLAADSLRQLVHELRTPTNAIAGFAEMIESEMLGPVAQSYRDRAGSIRVQARDLLGAIDDLDIAARIESAALALVPDRIVLRPLFARITDDLQQLMALRGSWIALPVDDLAVHGDRRAVERLFARLMATLVSASGDGERIGIRLAQDSEHQVAIVLDRPRALADYPGESLLGIDDEGGDATLLGTGFALRLSRNLARELGGSLVIEPESLTLRLPAPDNQLVEQAHLS